jgi:hypothetical protein
VDAIELSDGRYLVLADPPRYCAKVEFEAAFDLVAPASNGRRPRATRQPKARVKKATRPPTPKLPAGDAKARALELAKDKLSVAAIAAKLKRPYGTVYQWLKGRSGGSTKKVKAAGNGPKGEQLRRLCEGCGQKGISDPCEHCGEAR